MEKTQLNLQMEHAIMLTTNTYILCLPYICYDSGAKYECPQFKA